MIKSDTVTIVTDMLEEVFGFDKYSEITREYAIQGTFCDLSIKSVKKIEYRESCIRPGFMGRVKCNESTFLTVSVSSL